MLSSACFNNLKENIWSTELCQLKKTQVIMSKLISC